MAAQTEICDCCGGPRSSLSGELCLRCYRIQVVFKKRERAGWTEDEIYEDVSEEELFMVVELPKRSQQGEL